MFLNGSLWASCLDWDPSSCVLSQLIGAPLRARSISAHKRCTAALIGILKCAAQLRKVAVKHTCFHKAFIE